MADLGASVLISFRLKSPSAGEAHGAEMFYACLFCGSIITLAALSYLARSWEDLARSGRRHIRDSIVGVDSIVRSFDLDKAALADFNRDDAFTRNSSARLLPLRFVTP